MGESGRMPADRVPVRLSPEGLDQHGENARLRALGAAVEVELPDGVTAWAITRHEELQRLLGDPRVVKGVEHWAARARGEVPDSWPMLSFVTVRAMTATDGDAHRRLRGLVAQGFTARRIEALRPRIAHIVGELLDGLAADAPGPVDLRERFAYPLPIGVICELLGIPDERREELHALSAVMTDTTMAPEGVLKVQRSMYAGLGELIALKRESPGDDLTSDLIAARERGDRLSEEELVGTLLLMFVAGHNTTLNLLTNAVRALLTHPDQLALVRDGARPWSAVTEETLRWDAPVGRFPLRFATEDIEVDGAVIPKGAAILAAYGATGRDEAVHGPDADRFDVTRASSRHLAFGHGPHFCLGAPLARLEAELALPALFDRFPGLALAEPAERLRPLPSIVSNSSGSLPVLLSRG
ncbi:cytochrome P450 [Streptomyces sp. NPDC046215]|uniref:Cytochrome P450 n=1 Tax=Streptomyces stramineus TaxID=173861 RepID=A0ABN0ZN08_9ACTN